MNARVALALLSGFLGLAGFLGAASCGRRSPAPPAVAQSGSFSISVSTPRDGWLETVEYRTDGEFPVLLLDGVTFELHDPTVYRIDWEAMGVKGIEVMGPFTYNSTESVAGEPLSVEGRAVAIRDGRLLWGEEDLGPVEEGDRVRVDAQGLAIE